MKPVDKIPSLVLNFCFLIRLKEIYNDYNDDQHVQIQIMKVKRIEVIAFRAV